MRDKAAIDYQSLLRHGLPTSTLNTATPQAQIHEHQ